MSYRVLVSAVLLTAMLVQAGCTGSDDLFIPEPVSVEETEFAPELGVDLDAMIRTSQGLYYLDLEVGEGDIVESGDLVTFHFSGWVSDGTLFETTEGGEPESYWIGTGDVIPGWDIGVPGMRVGGKRKLVVPYFLGFGPLSDDVIPPYANLVFEIDVVGLQRPE